MFEFTAKSNSTPHRVFHIWSEPYTENGVPMNSWSWCIYVGEVDSNENEKPIYDGWETEFDMILRYAGRYADEALEWYDTSGKLVDLEQLKRELV